MSDKVVVILGSGSDEEFARPIGAALEKHGVKCEIRVISAHKRPKDLLEILNGYDTSGDHIVYITVAGRSNALSAVVDCNTNNLVIACPPPSDKFGGADIYSSLRMPTGVTPLVILEPENAALAAVKVLAYGNKALKSNVENYQKKMVEKNREDDAKINKK